MGNRQEGIEAHLPNPLVSDLRRGPDHVGTLVKCNGGKNYK